MNYKFCLNLFILVYIRIRRAKNQRIQPDPDLLPWVLGYQLNSFIKNTRS